MAKKKTKPKKAPVPQGTENLEREYFRLLRKYQLAYRKLLTEELELQLPALREQAKRDLPEGVRFDDFGDDFKRIFDRVTRRLSAIFPTETLKRWATAMVVGVSSLSKRNLDRTFKQMIDADPVFTEEGQLGPYLSNRVSENVALIQSIPLERLQNFQNLLVREVTAGTPVRDLMKQVRTEFQKTKNRAELLARDQVGKLNAEINQFRLKKLGVKRYIWRTVGDERVRSRHREVNGKTFSWDDPPSVGVNGQRVHPGQDIQCRCFAEPVLDEAIG